MNAIKEKVKSTKKCCVRNCQSTDRIKDLTLHMFPSRVNLLERWQKVLGRTETFLFVCTKHFKDSDYLTITGSERKRLKPDAVPSLNIPELATRIMPTRKAKIQQNDSIEENKGDDQILKNKSTLRKSNCKDTQKELIKDSKTPNKDLKSENKVNSKIAQNKLKLENKATSESQRESKERNEDNPKIESKPEKTGNVQDPKVSQNEDNKSKDAVTEEDDFVLDKAEDPATYIDEHEALSEYFTLKAKMRKELQQILHHKPRPNCYQNSYKNYDHREKKSLISCKQVALDPNIAESTEGSNKDPLDLTDMIESTKNKTPIKTEPITVEFNENEEHLICPKNAPIDCKKPIKAQKQLKIQKRIPKNRSCKSTVGTKINNELYSVRKILPKPEKRKVITTEIPTLLIQTNVTENNINMESLKMDETERAVDLKKSNIEPVDTEKPVETQTRNLKQLRKRKIIFIPKSNIKRWKNEQDCLVYSHSLPVRVEGNCVFVAKFKYIPISEENKQNVIELAHNLPTRFVDVIKATASGDIPFKEDHVMTISNMPLLFEQQAPESEPPDTHKDMHEQSLKLNPVKIEPEENYLLDNENSQENTKSVEKQVIKTEVIDTQDAGQNESDIDKVSDPSSMPVPPWLAAFFCEPTLEPIL